MLNMEFILSFLSILIIPIAGLVVKIANDISYIKGMLKIIEKNCKLFNYDK